MLRTALISAALAIAVSAPIRAAGDGGTVIAPRIAERHHVPLDGISPEDRKALQDQLNGAAPQIPCKPLDKLKAGLDRGVTLTPLTAGQFHFVQGVYVGSPATPAGLPPGDGALLAQRPGDDSGIVIWTHGTLACAPTPINAPLVKMIVAVKTGVGETAPTPSKDQEGDLHL